MLQHHFYFNWFYGKDNNRHLYNIGSGLFIWLFLWAALPFGIYENNLNNLFQVGLFLLLFGLAWTLISYAGDYVLFRWINTFNERKNKRSILLWSIKLLLLIHIIFVIRGLFCNWVCLDWIEYLQLYLACFIMFSITYIPFSLYGRYAYFHSLLGLASNNESTIVIRGEGKDHLRIDPGKILYVQSDDNYIDFVLADESHPGRKLIYRCTLRSLIDQLIAYPQFIRIHRSIIINVRYARPGEARPIRTVTMSFKNFSTELPVSKRYSVEVERIFSHPK